MIIKDNLVKIFPEYDYIRLSLKAERETVDKFCLENGYAPGKPYTFDRSRFSNGGGRLMCYYTQSTGWKDEFCFSGIVTSIIQ